MGPTIILDKSAIQSLNSTRTEVVEKLFIRVIPPVLALEILADIEKFSSGDGRKDAIKVAKRCQPPDAYYNADHRQILFDSLLGGPVAMKRVAVVNGGEKISTPDGKHGYMIGLQAEQLAMLRWSQGDFLDSDIENARRWRRDIESHDLTRKIEELRNEVAGNIKITSINELKDFVDYMMLYREAQHMLFSVGLSLVNAYQEYHYWLEHRWRNALHKDLIDFAPYAAHCVRVEMNFFLAITNNLIGAKNTNLIDKMYFYYTPFAQCFVSKDKLHRRFSHLLDEDQRFVWFDEFATSCDEFIPLLKRKNLTYDSVSENNVIVSLWKKLLNKHPIEYLNRVNGKVFRPKALDDKLKPIFDAMNNASKKQIKPDIWPPKSWGISNIDEE